MLTDFKTQVLTVVRQTPNTPEGCQAIVEIAEMSLDTLDRDIRLLLSQRVALVEILTQFMALYETFTGEELRTADELAKVQRTPASAEGALDLRNTILQFADWYAQEGDTGFVTDQAIVYNLRQNNIDMPWRNPKAVVATILVRSGKWKKVEPGRYVPVVKEETEED